MKKKYPHILYDSESEVFSVEAQSGDSVDSEISDSIVIDYDKQGKVVRLNFYNFSLEDFSKNQKAMNDFIQSRKGSFEIVRLR